MRRHIAACKADLFILFCLPVQPADGPVSLITDYGVFMTVLRQTGNYPLEKRQMIIYNNVDHLEAPLDLAVSQLLNDRREIAMSETLRAACCASLETAGKTYQYYSLAELPRPIRRLKNCHFLSKYC